jgi:pimeloyl-ACP methyl ester carboxylesterase
MAAITTIELRGRDGIRLVADQAGPATGRPVVLLHGGGQTRHAWGTTVSLLGDAGWHAVSVDLRGHGESDWAADGDYTLDAFSGDVAALARSFDTPPALVGASLGGIASLAAIVETPPPNSIATALVLVDVAPRIERTGVDRIRRFMTDKVGEGFASLDAAADAVAAYNPHRPRPTNLDGLRKNLRRRDDGRWVWHWDPRFISPPGGDPDETRSLVQPARLEAAARRLTLPTLLVRGRMSDLLSAEGAEELLELVPHARFADVADAGHMVAGDRNDLFNDAVLSFLASLD